MQALDRKLTDKEMTWIVEYFKTKLNAAEATRRIYGGTPGSCRVKGHKRLKRLLPVIEEICDRKFHNMQYQGISGIEFYLGDLKRRAEESLKYEGIIRMAMKSKRPMAYLDRAVRGMDAG